MLVLNWIMSPEMHGENPICEIKIEDIGTEIAYLKHSIVCYVLMAHPFLC